jgi:hypothetical protein
MKEDSGSLHGLHQPVREPASQVTHTSKKEPCVGTEAHESSFPNRLNQCSPEEQVFCPRVCS